MEETILADAIMDRITSNAHVTVLTCAESMRHHFGLPGWPTLMPRAPRHRDDDPGPAS